MEVIPEHSQFLPNCIVYTTKLGALQDRFILKRGPQFVLSDPQWPVTGETRSTGGDGWNPSGELDLSPKPPHRRQHES